MRPLLAGPVGDQNVGVGLGDRAEGRLSARRRARLAANAPGLPTAVAQRVRTKQRLSCICFPSITMHPTKNR